ncbi:glycosyltransferase family 2 protein [Clostridium sp.]|uniref:glycosyltransferase family 2 protein n=1 Tax=Clostridium sp. TaxID=1506 RepID=UPI002FC9E302
MKDLLFTFITIFEIMIFTISLYYVILSLCGLYRKKGGNTSNIRPKKRFALVVAAHNEEAVIAQILDSMKSLDYPKRLYDVFVIADNCTDKTAKIAKKHKALVYERFDDENRGKGFALEWMFTRIFAMDNKYDAIAIFDADNLISKNFLLEMNAQLLQGYKVVQGYIDSKNPHDSWITGSYSIAFWSVNRLFQLSRYNLGLSCQIGGTGFCVDTNILRELGWGATCLTEDLEFSCKLILSGYKVGWCHDAVVYDEKPLTLKQSWRQRKRWMQGFTDVASRFFTKLLKKSFKDKDFIALDCAIYTIQPFILLALVFSAILGFVLSVTHSGMSSSIINLLFAPIFIKVFSIFQFLFTPLVMMIEKKLSKGLFILFALYSLNVFIFNGLINNLDNIYEVSRYILYLMIFLIPLFIADREKSFKIFIWYLLYGVYTLTWVPITIQGIIHKNRKDWCHTKHTRQLTIDEM